MVTTANLLNYWKCWEDAANTTVEDFEGTNDATASTNTSNLADVGIPTNLDGSFNYNGTNEHIDLNLTQNTSDNFAYNFWIKTTDSASGFIGGVFDGTRTIFLGRINQLAQGELAFDIFDGTNNAKVSFTNQTWRDGNAHMITFTKTGNTQADMKIYLDGVSVESVAISGTLNNTTLTRDIFFGARNNQGNDDFNMAGNISDISRWSSVTEQDITDLYDSGDGNPFPFSVGPTPIEETDTTTITDSLTIARGPKTFIIDEDDTATLSDSLTIARSSKIVTLSISDTTNISDDLTINKFVENTINEDDTTTLSDSLTIFRSSKIFTLDLQDTTNISDSLTISKISISEQDTVGLSDVLELIKVPGIPEPEQIKTLITINDVDYPDSRQATVDKTISEFNTTGSFKIQFDNPFGRHNDTFSLNQDVLIKADITDDQPTTKIIRGIIEDIDFTGRGTSGKLTLSGRDYGAILQDIIVEPRIFKNTEASEIVNSLMRQNVSEITINNVETTSTTIDKITFNGVSVFNAIKQISEIAGFFFFVDEDKDLNFKQKDNISSGLTFDNTNVQNATFRQSDDDIFNSVKVVGDRQLTAAQQIFETGVDNTGSVYNLDSKPYNTKVTLSGAPNQILQPGGVVFINDPQTDNTKFLVDFSDTRIILTSGTAAGDNIQPTGSVVIIDYDQSTPLIKFAQDTTSINAFGLKQKEIIDKNIKDLPEANEIATTFIAENKDPKTQGTVKVKGIANIVPGQTALVNLPTQGQANETYSIIKARYTFNKINNLSKNVLNLTLSKKVNNFIDLFTQHELRLRSLETSEVESSISNVEVFAGSIGVSGVSTIIARDIGSGFYFNVTGHDILNSNTSLLGDVRGGSIVQVL